MLAFWAIAAGMVAIALAFVLPGVGRRNASARRLAGTPVPPANATSTTASGADATALAGQSARTRRRTAVALGVGLPLAAVALYALLGDPGALTGARSELSEQLLDADAPGSPEQTAHAYAELERHLARQPNDGRALVLKARLDMQAQRFDLAAAGYRQALQGPAKVATDATVWVEYAEALGMLQGGTLQGQPQQMVEKALSLDPAHPQALDLAGSAAWERRDFATAARYWKQLLEQIPAGSQRHVELSTAIEAADRRAQFSLPPPR